MGRGRWRALRGLREGVVGKKRPAMESLRAIAALLFGSLGAGGSMRRIPGLRLVVLLPPMVRGLLLGVEVGEGGERAGVRGRTTGVHGWLGVRGWLGPIMAPDPWKPKLPNHDTSSSSSSSSASDGRE